MDVFPFSDSDDFGEPELQIINGAFGDVYHAFKNPRCKPIDPAILPADPLHPEHKRIYYRLRNRFLYLREKQLFSRCTKKVDLVTMFLLLEFLKDIKPIRWTRLPNGEHDAAWRRIYSIVRERIVNFAANAYKVRLKPCYCLPWVRVTLGAGENRHNSGERKPYGGYSTCSEFVYPEYEAALQKAERESRAPWGYEMDVFMHLRRTLGNDMARLVIDYL
jgi:hypothetical protein